MPDLGWQVVTPEEAAEHDRDLIVARAALARGHSSEGVVTDG